MEYKGQEINRMSINRNIISTTVYMQVCTSIEDIQAATHEDTHLQELKSYIIYGLPHKKDELKDNIRHYWLIRSKLAMIDRVAMEGKNIIIPLLLQKQILQHVHSSHMGIEKMRLLAYESVCWLNINTDIKNTVKKCATSMEYQQTKPHEKIIPYKMLHKPWGWLALIYLLLKVVHYCKL